MIDSREIKDLHPCLQRGANELIRCMKEKNYLVLITSTYRDVEMQNKLYAQGRTTSGQVVTWVKGGDSFHNHKLAFDICKNIKGHEWDDNNFFLTAATIWQEMGGTAGYFWTKTQDKPHFEFTNGLTTTQLKNGLKMPDNIKMKWEEEEMPEIKKTDILVNGENVKFDSVNINGNTYSKLQDFNKSKTIVAKWNGKNTEINTKPL